MCGVAGIYAYHYASPSVDEDELRGIRDSMATRGPDGSGEWFSSDHHVGLGHKRLAIIDLTESGSQPMVGIKGSPVISFNGEIYNYKELRCQLEEKGYRFVSNSDTEVLLHLYAAYGENLVQHLRGMFAFALWDDEKKIMLLARDPYGIKPLYYADDGWSIRIASQIKALLTSDHISRLRDSAGVTSFFLMGHVLEPFTFYREIRQVPAGTTLMIDGQGPNHPKSFFSVSNTILSAISKNDDDEIMSQNICESLLRTVNYHFVSDVPVGVFLSGGIDSGVLVALADQLGYRNLETITLGYGEYRGMPGDEISLARETADRYGTRHHVRILEHTEFKRDLSSFFEAMDQPTIDGLNTYFVSKAAKEIGLKVALSGLGADEMFGGYPSFVKVPQYVNTLSGISKIPFMGQGWKLLYPLLRLVYPKLHPKFSGLLQYGGSYETAYFLHRGLFMPWELTSILGGEFLKEGLTRLNLSGRLKNETVFPGKKTEAATMMLLESSFYMRNQLLRDTDWASMAHSLEVRIPFVDSQLLSELAPYLVANKALNKKMLLARSPKRPLPENVLTHKKSGFTVPVDQWLFDDKELDDWRKIPSLRKASCPWARRWAYTVYQRLAV